MNTLALPDSKDWYSLPFAPCDYRSVLREDLRGLRIAFSTRLGLSEDLAIDPDNRRLVESAVAAFESLGATVVLADPPAIAACGEVVGAHFCAAAARLVASLGPRAPLLDASLRRLAQIGAGFSAEVVFDAQTRRAELGTSLNQFFDGFDLLIAPVIHLSPPRLTDIDPEKILEPVLTQWCNVTGLPAASVCCGFSAAGLPVGLQIIGGRWADATVLRASHAYELARGSVSDLPGYVRVPSVRL